MNIGRLLEFVESKEKLNKPALQGHEAADMCGHTAQCCVIEETDSSPTH